MSKNEVRIYLTQADGVKVDSLTKELGLANKTETVRHLMSLYEASKLSPMVTTKETLPEPSAPITSQNDVIPVTKSDIELLMEDIHRH